MKLAFAFTVAVVFGLGTYLLLKHDLIRVVLGVVLISQSAILTVISSGLARGQAPIHPLSNTPISDPLTQAMALTAIVISLATTALLLVLIHRVFMTYHTIELDELAQSEAAREAELERKDVPEQEEVTQ
jgi:multicomponent Na+:H+ antiporter subunit C